jgi:hypothetical protein
MKIKSFDYFDEFQRKCQTLIDFSQNLEELVDSRPINFGQKFTILAHTMGVTKLKFFNCSQKGATF